MDNHIKLYDVKFNRIPEHYLGPYFMEDYRFYDFCDATIRILNNGEMDKTTMELNVYSGHYFHTSKF